MCNLYITYNVYSLPPGSISETSGKRKCDQSQVSQIQPIRSEFSRASFPGSLGTVVKYLFSFKITYTFMLEMCFFIL